MLFEIRIVGRITRFTTRETTSRTLIREWHRNSSTDETHQPCVVQTVGGSIFPSGGGVDEAQASDQARGVTLDQRPRPRTQKWRVYLVVGWREGEGEGASGALEREDWRQWSVCDLKQRCRLFSSAHIILFDHKLWNYIWLVAALIPKFNFFN